MKNLIFTFILFGVFIPGIIAQTDFVVITNSSTPVESLTVKELKKIYLGHTTIWKNKTKIKPSYLQSSKSFWTEKGVDMSYTNYQRYWTKRIFSGYGVAPKKYSEDKEVIKYVSGIKGGIGIISASAKGSLNSDCKILTLK
ncbi:MAG: substrate-binding domain-containing protein [Bacteroidota bacterium]